MKQYTVYILECTNGGYYTGYTTDLARRYKEHQQGNAKCKYTRSYPPIRIAASWVVGDNLSDALKMEAKIKRLTRQQKHALIELCAR